MTVELDLIAPSSLPVVDASIDRMYQRMEAAAQAGDVSTLAGGIVGITHLIDRLHFVRTEAGRFTHDLLPDETYRYRRQTKVRKGPWSSDDGRTRVEPRMVGGGWRRFNYVEVLKAVAERAWGLEARVISSEGEVLGTVESLVSELAACVSFSNVRCDHEKGTGLAKWGMDREQFGEYDPPRRDVTVQRSEKT